MNQAVYFDYSTLREVVYCAVRLVRALMSGNRQLAEEYKWGLACHATHHEVDVEHYDRIRWHKEGHKYCQVIWFLAKYGGTRFMRGEFRDAVRLFVGWIGKELNRDTSHDDEIESHTLADIVIENNEIENISFLRGELYV